MDSVGRKKDQPRQLRQDAQAAANIDGDFAQDPLKFGDSAFPLLFPLPT